jgi:transposase-like protein
MSEKIIQLNEGIIKNELKERTRIRTNNVIERLNREIRRRTRVVGCFPDGNSALMLVCARLRHVAGTQWGNKKYMNMRHLEAMAHADIAG